MAASSCWICAIEKEVIRGSGELGAERTHGVGGQIKAWGEGFGRFDHQEKRQLSGPVACSACEFFVYSNCGEPEDARRVVLGPGYD